VSTVIQIVLYEEMKGDILAFMTGQEDIEEALSILTDKFKILHMADKVILMPLFANLP
jgi:HrpA-like RNA helicase